MVTRRAMLKGTAAGSIAAIASSHGVAASADSGAAGVGFGNLEGGALGAFHKLSNGFNLFIKFHKTAWEVFYKERTNPDGVEVVDIFYKFFDKGWGRFLKYDTLQGANLADAAAGFWKLESDVAGIFLKIRGHDDFNLLLDVDGPSKPGEDTIG